MVSIDIKIALVDEWLTETAGSERVLHAFHELYPRAPIYTSVYAPENVPRLAGADVRTSFMQKVPGAVRKHQAFPWLRTVAFERFDLSEYDVVISCCHAESKGVITRPETLHICYCYTPIRYYWSGNAQYLANPRYGVLNPVVKLVMPYMMNYLRVWDRCAADRVDLFVAISEYVASRIRKYYRREAGIIYPPVSTSAFHVSPNPDDYYLMVGRLVPYKRADLVIDAFNRLGLKLKIAGQGTEIESLKSRARPNIEFLGWVPDSELPELYSRCRAFIFPQEEEFGIAPLEAMASGRPVIAYRAGAAQETVIEGETGAFFDSQDEASLIEVVRSFEAESFDPERIRKHAEGFDVSVFQAKFGSLVESAWEGFRQGGLTDL